MMLFLDRANLFCRGNQEDFFCKEDWISDVTGFSLRTVKDCIKYLKSNGYLAVKRKGNYNRYAVVEKDGTPYVSVPHSLYLSENLTSAEKIMLVTLMDRERYFSFKTEGQYVKGFGFTCKIEWLGDTLGLEERQVKRAINSLKTKGMIVVTKSGRLNQYTINWDMIENSRNEQEAEIQPRNEEPAKSTVPEGIRSFLNNSKVGVCTPEHEDFRAFVYQEISQERMDLWLYLAKKKMGGRMVQEIDKYATELSARHYDGEYRQDIRDACLRRIRNAV